MKNSNGTSMVAVAIIVIVILLLIAGALLAFLGEKGVMSKARKENALKSIENEKKILEDIVKGAINSDTQIVDYGKIDIPFDWTISSKGKYISPTGNEFNVDENGKITYKLPEVDEDEEELKL